MKHSQPLIQVFCKAPIPGQVKTRLIETVGQQRALELHVEMIERLMDDLAQVDVETELWISPDVNHGFFDQYEDPRHLQSGADLGCRMNVALQEGLSRHEAVILIGTDLPLIDSTYIDLAIASLHENEVVLGPAEDGGYGLVGVRSSIPDIFDDIAWGSDKVLNETCRKLNANCVRYGLLPLIWDVDRPADIPRYEAWLDNT